MKKIENLKERIDWPGYLNHAASLSAADRSAAADINEWLPPSLVDCHAHSNLPAHAVEIGDRTLGHMLSSFVSFSIDESLRFRSLLHPGKKIRSLRFAKTFRGLDHRAANAYLLEESPAEDRVALFGLPEDVPYTAEMLAHPRAAALKMYYAYLDPPAQTIREAFPPALLEVAEALGKPIVLHLPRMLVHSIADLESVAREFPKLKIVVAHLGVSKFLVSGLREALARAAALPNVWTDTSLNPSPEVVAAALEVFGVCRVVYGSDEPLNLLRSVPYVHPERGQRIAVDHPYHWVDADEHREYGHLAAGAAHAHWTCLGAIRKALIPFPPAAQEEAKRRIFEENAAELFGF